MLERLQVDLKVSEVDEILYEKLSDKVNDAYGFIWASSQFIAPIIGSALDLSFGMRYTFDIIALVCIIYTLIIFTFNCGIYFIAENNKFHKQLEKYQAKENDDLLEDDHKDAS